MKSVRQIWQFVVKRAPLPRQQLADSLEKFLNGLDNPHAFVLTGQLTNDPCDQNSAQALEAWVVGEFREGKISKLDATEWLRLIFDAIAEFNRAGYTLFPTRLADVMRPDASPFSPSAMLARRRADHWCSALHVWISEGCTATNSGDWHAAIALSAVMHGVLLDSTKLNQLMDKLDRHECPIVESGISNILFDLPFQGLGNHHLQRWFIDPVSEMLIWRYLKTSKPLNNKSLIRKINSFLMAQGVVKNNCPEGLTDLMEVMVTWWSERAAPIDLQCATRGMVSHAIHERTWSRLQNTFYDPRAARKASIQNIDQITIDDISFDDIFLLNPWLAQSIEILQLDDQNAIKLGVTDLLSKQTDNSLPKVFLGWLNAMIAGFSATKEALALSTIRRRYSEAAPRLIGLLGVSNPIHMDTAMLEDYYAELTTDPDPLTPVRDIANGLRDFHAFLHRDYRKPLMRKEADVLGDENSLKPVDANLVSFDEYQRAQEWLDRQRVDKKDLQICKIVLMMAFKAGMRRMEIFGLQLSDIHIIGGLICLVRRNVMRRLKTQSSRRILPLFAFLSGTEISLLKNWVATRMVEIPPNLAQTLPVNYLFPKFSHEKSDAWIDSITNHVCESIREATGDRTLFLHHLRHSFGTWTYLRLRAPDFPDISRHFSTSPATVFAIHTGARLRVLLIGRNPATSRSYAFAVARLLGHSSPIVSLGHYVHSSDLILGAITRRECNQVPFNIIRAASGLQKSAAYEHMGDSIDSLLRASRQNFMSVIKNQSDSVGEKKARGRKPKVPAHLQAAWIPLEKIQTILMLSIGEGMSAADISTELQIDEQKISSILQEAGQMGPSIGLKSNETGQLAEFPKPVREKKAIEFCTRLEHSLADMALRAPVLCLEGISSHLEHFDRDKHDIVFHGKKHLKVAKRYLKFKESLGADASEYVWVIRVMDKEKTELPQWANSLKEHWRPSGIKLIRPKAVRWVSTYAEWIGVLPVDEEGQALGMAMAKTIFLARLAMGSFKSSDS